MIHGQQWQLQDNPKEGWMLDCSENSTCSVLGGDLLSILPINLIMGR